MVNAALWRLSQCHGHVQRPDRQIPLHTAADGPADNATGIQIKDDSQIQPAFTGPDIGYVARPFLVPTIRREVLSQQVGRNVERVVAVRRGLVFLSPDDLDTVLTHQTTHPPVPDVQVRNFSRVKGLKLMVLNTKFEWILVLDLPTIADGT